MGAIIGAGEHRYEVVENWAKLPAGRQFGFTHGVCETGDGRIFIHNQSPTGDATCIFSPDGEFLGSWGKDLASGAHGMQLRVETGKEYLYLAATTLNKVYKTTLGGEILMETGYPKQAKDAAGRAIYADEKEFVPTNVAFGPTGDFYVADGYGKPFIHQYDISGKYLRSWGGPGTAPGEFNCPHGIWCDTRDATSPLILVADRGNVRLQWFTLDGKFVKQVNHELRHPCHFDQRKGELLTPDLHGRVTIFGKDNQLVRHLGDNPVASQRGNPNVKADELKPGVFCTPHQAIWDRAGNIYCVEWLPYGRVTKLKRL